MKLLPFVLLCALAVAQIRPEAEGIRRDEMVSLAAGPLTATPQRPRAGEAVHLSLNVVNDSDNAARGVNVIVVAANARIAFGDSGCFRETHHGCAVQLDAQ